MISATRFKITEKAKDAGNVLFSLTFSLKDSASPGTYPVKIMPTTLNNIDALKSNKTVTNLIGSASSLNILIGSAPTYPVLIDDEIDESGYSVHVKQGSVTFLGESDYDKF
ncbi:hypothetical protein [Desulfonema magnum]|uniref:Uncharacterized protein n=1 Tax=Desulfonema magnum TaxID=45655 RepID=A0A975BFN5_9BACT|nr:hypothetical protein [Desulfonema magnum]QTA84443.1 Uncharacterized protein dnm_004390 [Desulfonema magnum]